MVDADTSADIVAMKCLRLQAPRSYAVSRASRLLVITSPFWNRQGMRLQQHHDPRALIEASDLSNVGAFWAGDHSGEHCGDRNALVSMTSMSVTLHTKANAATIGCTTGIAFQSIAGGTLGRLPRCRMCSIRSRRCRTICLPFWATSRRAGIGGAAVP